MTRAQVLATVLAEHDRNPATALCSCGSHRDFSLPFEHRAHVVAALDAALAAQEGEHECPACTVARILLHHRDQVTPTWDQRRVTLNFARIVAERACPDYAPTKGDDS